MEGFMLGMGIGAIIGTIGLVVVAIALGIYHLAKKDLFFTFVPEGEAKLVVRGDSYVETLMSLRGHHIDPITRDVVEGEADLPWLARRWGIYWVGIAPFYKVHEKNQKWASYEQRQEGGQVVYVAVPVEKTVKSVLVRDDVYVVTIPAAETNEQIPLNVTYTFKARSVNPYKTIFMVQHWLEAVNARIGQGGREYIGDRSYENLTKGRKIDNEETPSEEREFQSWLTGLGVIRKIKDEFGIEISDIGIVSIAPASDLARDFIQASTKIYVAEQNKQAQIKAAEGESASIDIRAEMIKKHGEIGELIVNNDTARAMAQGPSNIVVGSDILAAIAGLRKGDK